MPARRVPILGVTYALIAALTAVLGAAGWAYRPEPPPSSGDPALSADGGTLAFVSTTATLVRGDTNGTSDVFVKHLATGVVTRVSTAADGAGGNAWSVGPVVSADGTRVAFLSRASNLVPGDTNGATDVFVKDLRTGAVTRATTTATGAEMAAPGLDPLEADAAAAADPARVRSPYVEPSIRRLALSADGQVVAFLSRPTGPGRAAVFPDVLVKNLRTGAVTRPSEKAGGASDGGVALSADGSTVAFASARGNGFALVVRALSPGRTWRVEAEDGAMFDPSMSADGTKVAFTSTGRSLVPGDENDRPDVFVQDLRTGERLRASTTAKGRPLTRGATNPVLSADGTSVVFQTQSQAVPEDAHFNADVYVRDLRTGAVRRASATPTGADFGLDSRHPAVSADGRLVAFTVGWNCYVKNLSTGTLVRATPLPDDRPFAVKVWTQLL